MKIQKLTIHNIASIEDAILEFDKEPLASEPLFLITGETGSGKTTILNAICLALYNTSPNLKQIGSAEEDAEGVQTNNPRQLMRRGTTEAFISLTFEGNDEKHYEALWSVRRARNKPDGALQSVKRTLQCKETDVTFQKDAEIRQTIQDTVGLTFEQFCRTTMLAQGQFSKFMNSEEKDKAEILEKLTGTEIYARIGKKIFDLCKAKNIEFEKINSEIRGAQLLSEEETRTCKRQIELLQQQYTEQTALSKTIETQLHWLTEQASKQKAIEQCHKELQHLQEKITQEEAVEKKRLLLTWENTAEIRNILKNKTETEQQLIEKEQQQKTQALEFQKLLSGLNNLQKRLSEIRQTIRECKKEIDDELPHTPVYAAADRIAEYVKTLNEKNAYLQKYQDIQSANQKKLRSLTEKATTVKQEAEKAECAYKQQEELVACLRKETAHLNLQTLAETVSHGKEKINALLQAIAAVNNYLEKSEDYVSENSSLEKNKALLATEEKHKAKLEQQWAVAKQELVASENQYKGKQDLCDHITELQTLFQKEQTCPLCGSTVNGLHTEMILKEAVQEAKRLKDAARQKHDELQQKYAQAQANIIQLQNVCANGIQKLAQKKKTLDKAILQATGQTAPFNIDYRAENAIRCLTDMLESLKLQNKKDEQIQKDANIKREQLSQAESILTKSRTEIDSIQKAYQTHQENILLLNTQAARQKGVAEQTEKDIQSIRKELFLLVKKESYPENIDLNALNTEIQEKARRYTDNTDRFATLTRQESLLETEVKTALDISEPLKMLFPETETSVSQKIPQLNQALHNFNNEINLLQGAIQHTRENLKTIVCDANLYFQQHPDISEELIRHLIQIPVKTIELYRQEIEELEKDIQQKQGAYNQLIEQMENHSRQKPEIPQDASMESLTDKKNGIDTVIKTTHEEKIKLQTILSNNAERLQLLTHKRELSEQLRREKDNWNQLESIFGGAQGDKFKKIAQSYVLRALLEKANYYLQMLSNRYELECADGSLTINVIDNHQGGAIRNVGLLSGGEGFIVSLALALGLSAISKDKINVDTLFIDEGFGTLSNEYLEIVINTLDRLHQFGGRRVGIISHVAELAARIHTQIQVKRTGPSSSKIKVTTE